MSARESPPRSACLGERPFHGVATTGRPERGQRERAAAALPIEEGEKYVLLVHHLGTRAFRVPDRSHDHGPGVLREPLEHHCLPYFLCTACLLTPSSAAISCHDQP